MALRTRRISFIPHLSGVRLATKPVISADVDGHRWIPIDPIGFHSTNRYRRIPSDNIMCRLWFSPDFRYLFRVKRILLPLEGVKKRILPIPSENNVTHWCILEMYVKKFDIYLYRLIFLTTLFLTLIISSQVCSHLKLSTIGSCAAIESFTCQCARLIVLKNLLLLVIA